MGVFDRVWNLGKGVLRTRRGSAEERLTEAELEAELADLRPPVASRAPRAAADGALAAPADEGAAAPAEDEASGTGPDRDADGNIIKTL